MNYRRFAMVGLMAVAGLVLTLSHVVGAPEKKEEAKTITWTDYETGMKAAAEKKMPTMIDFATDWCGWCHKLDADVYTQEEIVKLAQQFICIKVDGDKQADLVKQYKIRGYPTIIFTNDQGEEIHRIVGYRPAAAFKAEMEKALANAKGDDDEKKE